MATRERTRCKPTGPEHERLRYGLVEWTPEDKPVTRAHNVPDDDPWYEEATDGTAETLDSRRSARATIPATQNEERIAQWPAVIHKMWITLWAPARRRAALPDVTSGLSPIWAAIQAWDLSERRRVAPV